MKITRKQLRKIILESVEKFANPQDALQNPRYRKDLPDMQSYVDSGIMQHREKLDSLYQKSEDEFDSSYANMARELEHTLTGVPVSKRFSVTEELVVSKFNSSAPRGREILTIKVAIPNEIIKALIESIDDYRSGNYNNLNDIMSDIRSSYYRYVDILTKAVSRVGPGAYIDEVTDNFEGISPAGSKRFKDAIETAGNLVG